MWTRNETKTDPLSNSMKIELNMFGALMKRRVFRNEDGSFVVTGHGHGTHN